MLKGIVPIDYARLQFQRRTLVMPDQRTFTQESDLQVLLWLASLSFAGGAIVELGTSDGKTLAEFAAQFPDRPCIGVDDGLPHGHQPTEVPIREPGWKAAGYANARVVRVASQDLDWESLGDISFVFIDADHTFEAAKADTWRAVEHLLSRRTPAIVAWHDYYDEGQELVGAEWVGVGRAVREFADRTGMRVGRVHGTCVAFVVINPPDRDLYTIEITSEPHVSRQYRFAAQEFPGSVRRWRGFDPVACHAAHHDYGGCYLVRPDSGNRQLGSFVSHAALWQHLAFGERSAIVFEDDARLQPEFWLMADLAPDKGLHQFAQTSGPFTCCCAYAISAAQAGNLVHLMSRRMTHIDLQMRYLADIGLLPISFSPYPVVKHGEDWVQT